MKMINLGTHDRIINEYDGWKIGDQVFALSSSISDYSEAAIITSKISMIIKYPKSVVFILDNGKSYDPNFLTRSPDELNDKLLSVKKLTKNENNYFEQSNN